MRHAVNISMSARALCTALNAMASTNNRSTSGPLMIRPHDITPRMRLVICHFYTNVNDTIKKIHMKGAAS